MRLDKVRSVVLVAVGPRKRNILKGDKVYGDGVKEKFRATVNYAAIGRLVCLHNSRRSRNSSPSLS